jgi:hypothetical protein
MAHYPPLLFGQAMQHRPVPPRGTRVQLGGARCWRGLTGTVVGSETWSDGCRVVAVRLRMRDGADVILRYWPAELETLGEGQ